MTIANITRYNLKFIYMQTTAYNYKFFGTNNDTEYKLMQVWFAGFWVA